MNHLFIISLFLLLGCQKRHGPDGGASETLVKQDPDQMRHQDSAAKAQKMQKAEARLDSLAAIVKAKPVWGDRMKVVGDFDGDGNQDTLYERYISLLTGKETNKDYDWSSSELDDGVDWIYYMQRWVSEKNPLVRLESNNPKISVFDIESGGCQNGIGYLKNVGDLNGDRKDEIVYYVYDVDMSMMNSCALATYKNGKWIAVHHWDIHEGDFIHEAGKPKPDPIYIKIEKGKVYCYEMADDGSGFIWKKLKINW